MLFSASVPKLFFFFFSRNTILLSYCAQFIERKTFDRMQGAAAAGIQIHAATRIQPQTNHHRSSLFSPCLLACCVRCLHFISFRSQSTMICHRCLFQCDGNSNKQGKNMYFVQLHKDEKERSKWSIFCSTELAIYLCHHPYYIYRRRSQNKSNHQFDSN